MATYNVTSTAQLSKAIISQFEIVLNKVSDKVKERVDQSLEQYYDEYHPEEREQYTTYFYHRTNQLRKCCKISPIIKGLNNITVEIYLDVDSLSYTNKGADPWKTVVSADAGLHGGWDFMNPKNDDGSNKDVFYQIPFSSLNDDSDYEGTRIWHDPMEELLKGGKLRRYFLEEAKKLGLNIIAK